MANLVREVFGGAGTLLRGFTILLRKPRLFLLGMLPALITSLLFLTAFVALVINLSDLVAWATPFAEGWDPVWQGVVRGALFVALLVGAVLLMVVTFTTVTLTLGAPVYDRITELVEEELGAAPPGSDESFAAGLLRAVRQAVAIILMSLLVTVLVFVIGFLPVVGQVIGAVLAAILGGWLLAIELVAGAFDRRSMLLIRHRHRFMKTRRLRVLGFAVPTYFLLAIPFVAVAVFPAAAAGGTILTRELLDGHQPQIPNAPQAPHPHPPVPPPPQGYPRA